MLGAVESPRRQRFGRALLNGSQMPSFCLCQGRMGTQPHLVVVPPGVDAKETQQFLHALCRNQIKKRLKLVIKNGKSVVSPNQLRGNGKQRSSPLVSFPRKGEGKVEVCMRKKDGVSKGWIAVYIYACATSLQCAFAAPIGCAFAHFLIFCSTGVWVARSSIHFAAGRDGARGHARGLSRRPQAARTLARGDHCGIPDDGDVGCRSRWR